MIGREPLAIRVRAIEPISPTLKQVILEAADGGVLPTSLPGAHLALSLPGRDRIFRNSYSIVSSDRERAHYAVIVRRTVTSRGGSAFIHDRLQPGDVIAATPPNSQFSLRNLARKHLLIAGGIGVTPFLSFLPALRDRGHRGELHHFAKPGEVALFEQLLTPHASHDVQVHAGRARALADILAGQPLGTHVYTCGPAGLMAAVADGAAALGWPASHIHSESFGAGGGAPFTVELARSGGEVRVGEHMTMLEALEDAGLPMPSLCRGGACGECRTRVIAGQPDHRDHFLKGSERAAGEWVMPCVSRAISPTLTIDL